MEQVSPSALTTLQRVKDLLFDPNLYFTIQGTTVSTSTGVSALVVPSNQVIRVGQIITGTGIPAGTTVAAIPTATTLTLSQAATANNTLVNLIITDQPAAFDTVLTRLINGSTNYINNECGRISFVQQTYTNEVYSIDNPRQTFLLLRNTPVFSISSFQWRAGTPTNPNWTDFIPDQFELVDPQPNPLGTGASALYYPKGEIRVYGVLPRIYSNMIRATYVGGYPVNWANAEDQNTHMLPGDLTFLCENLVVRNFKRRGLAGKSTEALAGATTSWRNELDATDLDVLGQYRDVHW